MAKKQKLKTPQEQLDEQVKDLAHEIDWWNTYLNGGGSDPFYTDGYNMNSIRRRIIWKKEKIEKLCAENSLERPKILDEAVPPEADSNFMANKEELLSKAITTLKEAKEDENYLYLKGIEKDILSNHVEIAKSTNLTNVLGYVFWLEKSIFKRDYVSMRGDVGLLSNGRPYMFEAFQTCAKRVREELEKYESTKVNGFTVQSNGQFSLL